MAKIVGDELRPLDELAPHPRNYNSHSQRQLKALASAIAATAFTAPVIVTPDGVILAGHARRLALIQMRGDNAAEPEGIGAGWLVPCRVVECTEQEALQILVTDNPRREWIDYDSEALASVLAELQANEGANKATWYDDVAVDQIIFELAGGSKGDDAEPFKSLRGASAFVKVIVATEQIDLFFEAMELTNSRSIAGAVDAICAHYVQTKGGADGTENKQQLLGQGDPSKEGSVPGKPRKRAGNARGNGAAV